MDKDLIAFLNAKRESDVVLGGQMYSMRLLPAEEMLQIRENSEEAGGDMSARSVFANAAILAASLSRQGERVFENAQEVMKTISADEIAELMEIFTGISNRFNPSAQGEREGIEQLKKACSTHHTNGSSGAC